MLLNNSTLSYKKIVIAKNYMEDLESNCTYTPEKIPHKTDANDLHFPKSFDLPLCL